MKKYKRKRKRRTVSAEKTLKDRTKTAEYVSNLLELHELQGVLLRRLDKEV